MAEATNTSSSFVYQNSEISIIGPAPAAAVLFAEEGNNIILDDMSLSGIETGGTAPIHIIGSNLDINRGIFKENSAETWGGVVYIADNCNVNIIDCTFENNEAYYGGAIAVDIGQGANEENIINVNIQNSYFENNTATTSGGAFYAKLFTARFEDALTFYNNIKL